MVSVCSLILFAVVIQFGLLALSFVVLFRLDYFTLGLNRGVSFYFLCYLILFTISYFVDCLVVWSCLFNFGCLLCCLCWLPICLLGLALHVVYVFICAVWLAVVLCYLLWCLQLILFWFIWVYLLVFWVLFDVLCMLCVWFCVRIMWVNLLWLLFNL